MLIVRLCPRSNLRGHCRFKGKAQAFRWKHGNADYCSELGQNGIPLAYAEYKPTKAGPVRPPITIQHGLLGSKNNWRSLSKTIANATGCNVYALDARNHGDSPHTDDMDYMLMASDLELFLREHEITRAFVLGHSMGGRTAMTFALTRPSVVEKLVVVDVAPTYMPQSVNEETASYLRCMQDMLPHLLPDMNVHDARLEADKRLASVARDKGVRQFLLMNLEKGEQGYEWQPNIPSLLRNLKHISRMEPLKGLVYRGDTLFICGKLSRYVRVEHHGAIKDFFPNSEIVYVEGAGHWVHADKPAEFVTILTQFLNGNR